MRLKPWCVGGSPVTSLLSFGGMLGAETLPPRAAWEFLGLRWFSMVGEAIHSCNMCRAAGEHADS